VGAIRDAVLGENDAERAEGIGLDDVHADVEERSMELFYRARFGDGEYLIATLERRASEIVSGKILELKVGAGRAVVNKNLLGQRREVGVAGRGAGEGRADR
jgi:CRISPR/Cas system CMR-associated protein Cmr3 (group 5 of RAMP superfamily)